MRAGVMRADENGLEMSVLPENRLTAGVRGLARNSERLAVLRGEPLTLRNR